MLVPLYVCVCMCVFPRRLCCYEIQDHSEQFETKLISWIWNHIRIMAIHGLTDTRTNRFVFEISLDGFWGNAEEIFIIECGGHVAVMCLFECVYEHEIARQAHDDNVSSLAATSQRKTAPRPLADEKLLFCSPDSGHECELHFLLFIFFESERKKNTHFINDRSVNTYCFRRKGNETMTKSKTKRTR